MGLRFLPPDPRPSKADAEARKLRKELEKTSSFDWIKPVLLGLLGVNLAINVANDVTKLEAKHEEEERKEEEKKKRRRERDQQHGRERHDENDPFRSRRIRQNPEGDSDRERGQGQGRRDRSEQPRGGGSGGGNSRYGGSSRGGDDRYGDYSGRYEDDRNRSYPMRYGQRDRGYGDRDDRRQSVRDDGGRGGTYLDDRPPPRPRPRRYSSDF